MNLSRFEITVKSMPRPISCVSIIINMIGLAFESIKHNS